MRELFRKIPFYIKLPLLAGGSLMVFIGFFYGFYTKVTVLGSEFWLANPELKLLLRESFLEFFLIGVILIIVIWVLFYSDLISNLRYMNGQLATAVAKKQITVSFDRFESNDVFGDIAHHTDELFSLFNEFDGMKSSRIAMEVNTTKQLMKTISEGVLLVNTDRGSSPTIPSATTTRCSAPPRSG